MKKLLLVSGLVSLIGCVALFAQAPKPAPAAKAPPPKVEATKGGTETVVVLQTKLGKIVMKFFPDKAPNHVKNFQTLCKAGFYNGTKFHRVIPNFMIQGGDPNTLKAEPDTWGQGGNVGKDGKESTVKAEFNDIHHGRGIVSMARANDPNSASSQFFICVADAGFLDGKYSAFGEVIEGMDVADKIVNAARNPSNDRPNDPVAIDKATVEQRSVAPAAPVTAPTTAPVK